MLILAARWVWRHRRTLAECADCAQAGAAADLLAAERGHDAGIDLAVEVIRREVSDERLARRLVHELILAARCRTPG